MVRFVKIAVGGWVTTCQEPIKLDNTDYALRVGPIKNPSIKIVHCIAGLLSCNFLTAKTKLQNEIIFTKKATTILDIALELKKNDIAFTIVPDFPYEI